MLYIKRNFHFSLGNFTKPSIENKFEIPIDNFQKFKLNFFPTESIHPRQTFIRNPPIEKELQVARFQFPHSFFEGNGGNSVGINHFFSFYLLFQVLISLFFF